MDDRLPYMDDILPYMGMDDRLPLSLEICFLHTKQKRKDKMAATQDSMCFLLPTKRTVLNDNFHPNFNKYE